MNRTNLNNTLLAIIAILLFVLLVYHLIFIPRCYDSYTKIKILYRQAARWAMAADQDESDLVRVLHANYAAGYLWALKDIVSEQEFKVATLTDFSEFEASIVKIQNESTKRLVDRCKPLLDNLKIDDVIKEAVYKSSI
jgi:hypothetical protein